MTQLDKIIKELCPKGVNRFRIDEICNISRGVVISKDYIKDNLGQYPVYSSQTENEGCLGYINTYNFDGEFLTWTTDGANAGTVFYRDGRFSVTNVCGLLSVKRPGVLTKYIYYVLCIEAPKFVNAGMGNPKLMSNVMARITIPVPPLPVQEEIVRILDSFTELTAELTAELTVRKKQYEYYRDKLLTPTLSIPFKKLCDICDISTGSSNTDEAVENGKYPFFVRSQEPLRKNEYEFDEEAIITAGDGVGVGKVFHHVIGKYALHQRAYRIHPNNADICGRYLYHYFISAFPKYIEKQMFQGSVPSIRRPMLNSFEVPVPSLETQNKIVQVLDNFDSICSDLKIGLPAEIEARRKQYEYYRDLLLSFASDSSQSVNVERERERGRAER